MTDTNITSDTLLTRILEAPRKGARRVVALAGPPASGKSTLADTLATKLTDLGHTAESLPMDGFHLDNGILTSRGLLDRKGAPETFDARGVVALVSVLGAGDEVFFPTFDRARDIAIAGSGVLSSECDTVIVEGNYLLYDAPIWRELQKFWDVSVFLDIPEATLEQRLVERWLTHGLSPDQALTRARSNDLRNARLMATARLSADFVISS